MGSFIKGLELCEAFFMEAAKPLIERHFPGLRYSAGLLGYGSDVLGYDDEVSTDHMWGPRFYLFLNEADISLKAKIMDVFSENFPYEYKGHSVHFSVPNPNDGGVRCPEFITSGSVSPLVWIHTIDEFVTDYLGMYPETNADWLSISEHRLLGFTSGKLFVDMLDVESVRERLRHYPADVRLYLIASQWSLIAEEQAFVKRCGTRGDEIGSRIICARIADRLMHLCFLYENRYAPYSKWFGTGFKNLPVDAEIKERLLSALGAAGVEDREENLIQAQALVAGLHNRSGLTDEFDIKIQSYFGRDIKVLFVDKIVALTKEKISDPVLRECPMIGSLSQIGNFVELSDDPQYIKRIKGIYTS